MVLSRHVVYSYLHRHPSAVGHLTKSVGMGGGGARGEGARRKGGEGGGGREATSWWDTKVMHTTANRGLQTAACPPNHPPHSSNPSIQNRRQPSSPTRVAGNQARTSVKSGFRVGSSATSRHTMYRSDLPKMYRVLCRMVTTDRNLAFTPVSSSTCTHEQQAPVHRPPQVTSKPPPPPTTTTTIPPPPTTTITTIAPTSPECDKRGGRQKEVGLFAARNNPTLVRARAQADASG
jgi:hypothetical protein